MPYVSPPTWAFGDTVPASQMQIYSDNLNFLYDQLGQPEGIVQPAILLTTSGSEIITNQFRWLIYDDNGIIRDPDGVGADVALPNPDPAFPYYDLYSIAWMFPGKTYLVIDVDNAYEVADPTA